MRTEVATGCLGVVLICLPKATGAGPTEPGFHPRVSVSAPTRLDWTFALTNQSLATVPAGWLGDYDSAKQTYELFVPPRRDRKATLAVILYVSPSSEPGGWKAFEKLARGQGVLYASPRGAGNDCPPRKRVRIVLDVLDDLRRHHPIDPDRTCIAGFSGGGRIACHVAFALPELFGGALPICAGEFLREEPWLRQRVADRLSVALLTGEADFNKGEVERLRTPYLKHVGVRARSWTQPGLGHAIPNEKVLTEAYRWLEQDLPRRRALAKTHPASRLGPEQDSSREALAKALFAEGKKRLSEKGSLYPGLMQLKGVLQRWPDTGAAKSARQVLEEYDARPQKPWEADDLAEQRRFLVARARALDGYASGPLAEQYRKNRTQWLKGAIGVWKEVASDQPDSEVGKEAKKRIAALEKLLAGE